MDIKQFAMRKKKAHRLWKQYVKACKDNPKDKFLQDMKSVYNQLKSGRKIIDIGKVMEKAGINPRTFEPRLGITQAKARTCFMKYYKEGDALFTKHPISRWYERKVEDVFVRGVFPDLPEKLYNNKYDNWMGRITAVPKIPASLRPEGKLTNYYVLWEVDEWKRVKVPKDPFLLRRLTRNMFVIVAGWDLTELERSVIKGRVW